MNKNTKILGIVFLMTILSLSLTTISALSPYQENLTKNMGSWESFKYNLAHGSYLFTAWGEANDCSTEPDRRYNLHNGQFTNCNSAGCSYNKCAIDIWTYSTIYLGSSSPDMNDWGSDPRSWNREIGAVGASFTTPSSANPWSYVEVYCCPETPSGDDWETHVYTCNAATGGWTSRGTFGKTEHCSYDTSGVDLCWCNDEDENFYVDKFGGVHCRQSNYPSVTNGDYCPQPECTQASDCGQIHYTGENYCYLGDVAKNQVSYTCENHECKSHDANIIQQECTGGCTNGVCNENNPDATCSQNGGSCKLLCSATENEIAGTCTLGGQKCCKTEDNGVGDGEVGAACSQDSDCVTNNCDKHGWWIFGSYKCSPVPWSESKKIAVTREQLSPMTNQEKLAYVCLTSSQCIAPINSSASCISVKSLKEDGTLTDSVGFLSATKTTIDGVVGGATFSAIGGAVLCGVTFIASGVLTVGTGGAGSVTIPAAFGICASVTGGAALIGAGVGYVASQHQIAIANDDPLVKAVKAQDENSVGLCIAEQQYSWCKYTSWAGFFKITGNKCTDGLIIIFALLILLALILRG